MCGKTTSAYDAASLMDMLSAQYDRAYQGGSGKAGKMMEWITDMDGAILLFIQDAVRNPGLTPVFIAITVLGIPKRFGSLRYRTHAAAKELAVCPEGKE